MVLVDALRPTQLQVICNGALALRAYVITECDYAASFHSASPRQSQQAPIQNAPVCENALVTTRRHCLSARGGSGAAVCDEIQHEHVQSPRSALCAELTAVVSPIRVLCQRLDL